MFAFAKPCSHGEGKAKKGGQEKVAKEAAEQAAKKEQNVFSENYKGPTMLKRGDAGYGLAEAGSATEARAQKAQEWVDKEIGKLISVIEEFGTKQPNGKPMTTFGPLFIAYTDISVTLVGILMRAKKRKQLFYEGDMLFQGSHDKVEIEVL
jgi:hypothetical protein